jgi:catechol 2,3-dioxygenase-like lactoylglutathione lyase family enzyme
MASHGKYSHIEIPADNPARAKAFYEGVFGWQFADATGLTLMQRANHSLRLEMDRARPGLWNSAAGRDPHYMVRSRLEAVGVSAPAGNDTHPRRRAGADCGAPTHRESGDTQRRGLPHAACHTRPAQD